VGRDGDGVAEAEGLSLVEGEGEQVEMFQLDAAGCSECSKGILSGRVVEAWCRGAVLRVAWWFGASFRWCVLVYCCRSLFLTKDPRLAVNHILHPYDECA
jgi:hypothetical protein